MMTSGWQQSFRAADRFVRAAFGRWALTAKTCSSAAAKSGVAMLSMTVLAACGGRVVVDSSATCVSGGVCGGPDLCGPLIAWESMPGAPPVARGGAFEPGRYGEVSAVDYNTSIIQGLEFRETIVFNMDGNYALSITDEFTPDGMPGDAPISDLVGASGSYVVSGNMIVLTQSCPSSGTIPYGYSVDEGLLTIYLYFGQGNAGLVGVWQQM
jgi:hypothetical protein